MNATRQPSADQTSATVYLVLADTADSYRDCDIRVTESVMRRLCVEFFPRFHVSCVRVIPAPTGQDYDSITLITHEGDVTLRPEYGDDVETLADFAGRAFVRKTGTFAGI